MNNMNFAEGMKKIIENLDRILAIPEILTDDRIQLFELMSKINTDELEKIIIAAEKIESSKGDILTAESSLHDIREVILIQNQVNHVSNIRDSIGEVVGSLDDIKRAADYATVFGGVAAMKPMIDEVLKLSVKMDLVLDLEEKMDSLLEVEARLDSKLEEMSDIETRASKSSLLAVDMLNKITVKEQCVNEKLKEVKGYRDEMVDFNIDVGFVPYDRESTSTYIPRTNTLVLKLREGKPGIKGEPGEDGEVGQPGTAVHKGDRGKRGDTGAKGKDLNIDAMGTMQERKRYGNRPVGFTFLVLDKRIPMLYFRKSNTLDDWTDGIPFGSNPIKHADNAANAEKFMGMTLVQLKAYLKK